MDTSNKYCEETCFGCGWSRFYQIGKADKTKVCPKCGELLERFAHSEDEFLRICHLEGAGGGTDD